MTEAWMWIHWAAFLALTGAGTYAFFRVVGSRYAYVRLGVPFGGRELAEAAKDAARRGVRRFAAEVFGQTKLLKDRRSGWMHVVVFYGFLVLQLGAIDIFIRGLFDARLPLPAGWYGAFDLLQEASVALVLAAMAYAAYRRYGEKLKRLKRGWKPSLVVLFIYALLATVLLTLAFDRLRHGEEPSWTAPIASSLAAAFGGLGETGAAVAFYAAWYAHLLALLAFLVYVPQSKHFHIVTAPLNVLLKKTEPPGRLAKLDLEDETAETFGVGAVEAFTQKQLLDLFACVECGRCTNVCPASNTGKLLSPMHLIVKLRDHLVEKGAAITSKSPWVPAIGAAAGGGAHAMREIAPEWPGTQSARSGTPRPETPSETPSAEPETPSPAPVTDIGPTMAAQQASWVRSPEADPRDVPLVGGVLSEEEIWACTTCRNCEDQCPVDNEHVDKIVDLRRYLVLTEGRMPPDGQRAMQNIERQGNPWGLPRGDRANWAAELGVPTVRERPDFDYLFFVGSMGAYDNRTKRVTRAVARLLREAGVSFAILGNEEKNSGDTPRRMGNEMLFQQLAAENIAAFEKYGVTKIVTACPHTYNTLKNEYPEFGLGAHVEVLHHTELLAKLVADGRLRPTRAVRERVVYHDSCYLGRYNEVYDAPRDVLRAIPGVELREMARNRENGMCCGAGGGRMWMEETQGKRVNVARVEQALAVEPTVVASACPYCLTMMEDGAKLKDVEDAVKTRDVAELLEASVFGGER